MVSIYSYLDYRKYLQDFYKAKKEKSYYYSYKHFSQLAGIKAPNYLKLIMEGKRNLTSDNVYRFAKALDLNKAETEYFELLVSYDRSRDEGVKSELLKKLQKYREVKGIKILRDKELQVLSKWQYFALRELVNVIDFKNDAAYIQERLDFSLAKEEISEALRVLQELDLLRGEEGKLVQTDKFISFKDESYKLALKNFHLEIMKLAGLALHKQDSEKREYGAITMAISKEAKAKIKNHIKETQKQIFKIIDEDDKPADCLYQFAVQFFSILK